MTPMAAILPSIELLVPGAVIIQFVLGFDSSSSVASDVANANTSFFIFPAIAIAMGFLVGEAILATIVPGIGGVLRPRVFTGPLNHWNPLEVFHADNVVQSLPAGCHDYITIVAHRGINLIAADINGKSDPYIRINVCSDFEAPFRSSTTIARSTIQHKTLNPIWEEAFVIPIMYDSNGDMKCKIRILDHDHLSNDDDLGHLNLQFDGLNFNLIVSDQEKEHSLSFTEGMRKTYSKCFKLRDVKRGEFECTISYHHVEKVEMKFKKRPNQTDEIYAKRQSLFYAGNDLSNNIDPVYETFQPSPKQLDMLSAAMSC
eukprot:Pgem_evm1s6783